MWQPQPATAQLLYKPGEPYVNYAHESYRSYQNMIFSRDRLPVFDPLGQFVMNGTEVFRLDESRTLAPAPGTLISKPRLYQSYLNRLVIANDSYGGASTKLIIGDKVRTKFTSLTLDLTAMNGLRLDTDFEGGSLILAASRVDRPIFEALGQQNVDHRVHGVEERFETRPRWATYLLGGDLRTQLPGLDMGVSWVNQFRTDSMKDMGENSFRGTLPTTGSPPSFIVVRVADQEPEDVVGVRVQVPTITLNGRRLQHTLGPYDRLNPDALTLMVTEHVDRTIIPPIIWRDAQDPIIEHAHISPTPEGFYQTRGPGSLLFWFRVPSTFQEDGQTEVIDQAHVDLDVSGDYVVELSEVFDGNSNNPATYFYTAARSRGRPDNLNDFRRVRAHYGRQTGRTLTSAHVNLNVKGFMLQTEYVRNFSFRAYPALVTNKLDYVQDESAAWLAAFKREWERFSIGGELFNVDADYSTLLVVQDDAFNTSAGFPSAPFNYPQQIYEPSLPTKIGRNITDQTYTRELNTVDDNDDKDQYPDTYYLRKTTNPETGGRFIQDPDGVFPGLDADLNGRPDINENNNQIPDYYEPFLLYRVNPDAYEWGDDVNNNGKIDERENDMKSDYPFDPDRRGYHSFAQYFSGRSTTVTVGHHRTWAPFAGGEARSTYAKVEYERRIPFLVDIYGVERLKQVEDDIADDIFGLGREPIYFEPDIIAIVPLTEEEMLNPLGEAQLLKDPLHMRESWVNTFYTRTRYIGTPNLNVEVSVKYETNRQQSTSLQPANDISDLATVFKVDYDWNPWMRLRIIPQLKWMRQRLQDDEDRILEIKENFLYPILRLEYPLSLRTTIKFGAQGLPFFKGRYRNGTSDDVDFDSENYLALLSNTSTYVGYQINVNLGYEKRIRSFLDRDRRDQDIDLSRLFLRVIVGLRPQF
ncbi:MAG: hypothetical protein VX733_05130 [Candidatus Latescibacterota bacterium]|nr:hypothetical protein [Candidatus Latescibacterota bacterium]